MILILSNVSAHLANELIEIKIEVRIILKLHINTFKHKRFKSQFYIFLNRNEQELGLEEESKNRKR